MEAFDDISKLEKLGANKTNYTFSGPSVGILETFPNKFPQRDYVVMHETNEFSSLCPKTGQPDFAHIVIRYIPDNNCVESKSLKLYWFTYRNEGSFMESIVNRMLEDLVACMQPRWLEVTGKFNARGGINTTVQATYCKE